MRGRAMIGITLEFTTDDGSYPGANFADYFRDHGLDIAYRATDVKSAEFILRQTYLGPDVDGVGVVWDVYEMDVP